MPSKLAAICPLDGRYRRKVDDLARILEREQLCSVDQEHWEIVKSLSPHSSEHALIANRVRVEVAYLQELAREGLVEMRGDDLAAVESLCKVTEADAQLIKDIEVKGVPGINNGDKTTHDVKAVEYYMRAKLEKLGFSPKKLTMIHFALTSEDIDTSSYTLMFKGAVDTLLPVLETAIGNDGFSNELKREKNNLEKLVFTGKMAGAIGNYSAHRATFPEIDWEELSKRFVSRLILSTCL